MKLCGRYNNIYVFNVHVSIIRNGRFTEPRKPYYIKIIGQNVFFPRCLGIRNFVVAVDFLKWS